MGTLIDIYPPPSFFTTHIMISVVALTAGYSGPSVLPKTRIGASMVDIAGLKELAKSQNPVVVRRASSTRMRLARDCLVLARRRCACACLHASRQ